MVGSSMVVCRTLFQAIEATRLVARQASSNWIPKHCEATNEVSMKACRQKIRALNRYCASGAVDDTAGVMMVENNGWHG